MIKPITELKTNRPVLRELFEDIKQYKKLIKIIFLQTDRFARFPKDFYQLIKFDTSISAKRLLRNICLLLFNLN